MVTFIFQPGKLYISSIYLCLSNAGVVVEEAANKRDIIMDLDDDPYIESVLTE